MERTQADMGRSHIEHEVLKAPGITIGIREGEHDAWLDGLLVAEESALGDQRPDVINAITSRREMM